MSRRTSSWVVPLLLLAGLAAATQPQYQKAKLLSLERKTRSRVLYYQVNTPVTREDPYYGISVDANHTTYVGEWVPRHDDDTPPDSWKVGDMLEVRLEKHYIYLKQPGGMDMKLEIMKRFATAPASPAN
jgi:hypothetical protein